MIAALAGAVRSTIGPHTLLATIVQLITFPEHTFFTMTFPAASTSTPRLPFEQVFPSIALSDAVACTFEPSPLTPLFEHVLPRIADADEHRIPSSELNRAVHASTVLPIPTLIPFP